MVRARTLGMGVTLAACLAVGGPAACSDGPRDLPPDAPDGQALVPTATADVGVGPGPAPVAPPDAAKDDAASPPARPQRFVLLGDFGFDDTNEAAVAGLVKAWNPDFVVTLGDNSYPSSTPESIDETIGKYYAELISPYRGKYGPGAQKQRFFACLGNHDWDAGSVQAHLDYFVLPGNERYWELQEGAFRFFCVDSDKREPDGTSPTSVQGRWLETQLRAARDPYRVVVFHHPAHSSGFHGSQTYMQWPFQEWGAQAVYTGHDHDYERFDFGPSAIPYVVQGTGGADLRPMNASRPGSVVAYSEKHGATFVTADAYYADFVATTVGLDRIDEHVVPSERERARPTDLLVPPGASLRYFDGAPPPGWQTPAVDASALRVGNAPLGYGQGGEGTILPRSLAHYVIKTFTLADPRAYDHLVVWLRRDDGVCVYMNGEEVGRSNLPDGALTTSTLAKETVGFAAEAAWVPIVVPGRLLKAGDNRLAVELHQASATSSDAILDLRVEGKR